MPLVRNHGRPLDMITPDGRYDRRAILAQARRLVHVDHPLIRDSLTPEIRRRCWSYALTSAWARANGEMQCANIILGRFKPLSAREARELSTDGRL